MNTYQIRKVRDEDASSVISIFNYYIQNSFSAYPEQPVPEQIFGMMKNMVRNECFYVAESNDGTIAGFAMLKHFQPMSSFARSAEVSYFLDRNHTGKGLGTQFLQQLETDARSLNVKTLLASISTLNEQSIAFHKKYGFTECGRLNNVGFKLNQEFGIVWMQKDL